MPRKKSASKKARQAAEQSKLEKQLENADESVKKQIQEEFESDEEDSTSEEEDEYGELLTEDVQEGFQRVLTALKNNDDILHDPNVKFFKESDGTTTTTKSEKQKPIYLKDYHRMNLLAGNTGADDEEEEKGEEFKTYDQVKNEERNSLLSEIKNAFHDVKDESDDEDAFMQKKEKTQDNKPSRVLPNPDEDSEKFLQEFVSQHAWIPQEGDKTINLDRQGEDDDEFEEAVEKFEHAYNFRYEEANSAEIISYARSQATMRRDNTNARKRKREKEKEEKEKEKKEKDKLFQKKKTEELNKLADFLEKIQKEYGMEIDEKTAKKISDRLLDEDFDDSQWDTVLGEIFDGGADDGAKPTWDDDDEIMKEFNDQQAEDGEPEDEADDAEDVGEAVESETKTKKDELSEKKKGKKDKKKAKEIASKVLEENKLKLMDKVEEEREGRSKERKETFKYREVSPESYGLTAREIFMADDADLNEFVGLKKLAPYRPKELRVKDRRKLAKSKNLKEWRKKVFKNPDGPEGNPDEILIPVEDDNNHQKGGNKNKKKRKIQN